MKRIGIAASKMAKGNLVLYNLYVILIASLFSLFVFLIAGSTIVFALSLIAYVGREIMGSGRDFWSMTLTVCLMTLSVVTGIFTLMAIVKNIKFRKSRKNI